MKTSHPPLVATWLLERLYSGGESESLIGDLMECYRHGRSAPWYWRQVLAAILLSFCREVRGHILLAIRAVITGWGAFLMLRFASLGMLSRFHPHFRLVTHLGSTVGLPLTWLIFWMPIWVASGWFLAAHHRSHAAFMLLAFSASVLFWNLQDAAWTTHLLFDSVSNRRFFPQFTFGVMQVTLPPFCIVLGGLLAGHSKAGSAVQESTT